MVALGGKFSYYPQIIEKDANTKDAVCPRSLVYKLQSQDMNSKSSGYRVWVKNQHMALMFWTQLQFLHSSLGKVPQFPGHWHGRGQQGSCFYGLLISSLSSELVLEEIMADPGNECIPHSWGSRYWCSLPKTHGSSLLLTARVLLGEGKVCYSYNLTACSPSS